MASDPNSADQKWTATTTPDGGKPALATTWTRVSTSPLGVTAAATLDTADRIVAIQPPKSALVPLLGTSFGYDGYGHLQTVTQTPSGPSYLPRTTTFTYDPATGFLTGIEDAASHSTTFTRDPVGRVKSRQDPLGWITSYGYDPNGNLTLVTVPPLSDMLGTPRTHELHYNPVDLLDQYTPPQSDCTHTVFPTGSNLDCSSTPSTGYAYYLDRLLSDEYRPDGVHVHLDYDASRRLSTTTATGASYTLTDASGAHDVTIPAETVKRTYDPDTGLPSTIALSGQTAAGETLTYGFVGRTLVSTAWGGEVTGTVSRTFDTKMRVAGESVTDATGSVVTGDPILFSYDQDNRLVNAGALVVGRDYQAGSASTDLATSVTVGGVSRAYAYTIFGELASITTSPDLYSVVYDTATAHRDTVGRVVTKTETYPSQAGYSASYTYTYDDAGRLTDVSAPSGPPSGDPLCRHYDYDGNGNRIVEEDCTAGTKTKATYDGQDRLLSYGDTTFDYGPNGERIAKTDASGTTTYAYDAFGNLLHVALPSGVTIDYVPDALGRRVERTKTTPPATASGTPTVEVRRWIYRDSLRPAAELDGNGNVVSRFVYADSGPTPAYFVHYVNGVKDATYAVISDQLGSPKRIVGAAGTLTRIAHDAWGVEIWDAASPESVGFPFGFGGGLYDADTGLVRFGARDYDARVGRWLSRDPTMLRNGSNLYVYVAADPINRVDPGGTGDYGAFSVSISSFYWVGGSLTIGYDTASGSVFFSPALGVGVGAGVGVSYCPLGAAEGASGDVTIAVPFVSGAATMGTTGGGFCLGTGSKVGGWAELGVTVGGDRSASPFGAYPSSGPACTSPAPGTSADDPTEFYQVPP